MFFLATKCLIVDVTIEENRTARIAIVEAFYGLGWLIGLPLGTYANNHLGSVTLYSSGLVLSLFTVCYVALCVKESYPGVDKEQSTRSGNEQEMRNKIGCYKGNH